MRSTPFLRISAANIGPTRVHSSSRRSLARRAGQGLHPIAFRPRSGSMLVDERTFAEHGIARVDLNLRHRSLRRIACHGLGAAVPGAHLNDAWGRRAGLDTDRRRGAGAGGVLARTAVVAGPYTGLLELEVDRTDPRGRALQLLTGDLAGAATGEGHIGEAVARVDRVTRHRELDAALLQVVEVHGNLVGVDQHGDPRGARLDRDAVCERRPAGEGERGRARGRQDEAQSWHWRTPRGGRRGHSSADWSWAERRATQTKARPWFSPGARPAIGMPGKAVASRLFGITVPASRGKTIEAARPAWDLGACRPIRRAWPASATPQPAL